MEIDLLIKGGRVIDPGNQGDETLDVAVNGGKIFKVGKNLDVAAKDVYDASGCIVTPGLIDAHVHCYEYATPLGVNPDNTCLARGVTTVVDAGSAGASTFMGLRKYVVDKCKTRVRCLLHIALHGLAAAGLAGGAIGGESDTLAILDEDACAKCIQDNRDVIVGVKVRLTANVCGQGKTEMEAFRRALAVAERCSLPLMVHHSHSTVPTQHSDDPSAILSCPGHMKTGDIYTHTYHGYESTILDVTTHAVCSDVINARSRGVLFDVGHGAGAFSWRVAELALKQGFYPDLLGTDLHTFNSEGPVYDMPTVMTKFLHLGMPLYDIIKSVTSAPAQAYGLSSEIGSFTSGKAADVTVLKIEDCDVTLEDCVGDTRNIRQKVVPVAVWRDGNKFPINLPDKWPDERVKSSKVSLGNKSRELIK